MAKNILNLIKNRLVIFALLFYGFFMVTILGWFDSLSTRVFYSILFYIDIYAIYTALKLNNIYGKVVLLAFSLILMVIAIFGMNFNLVTP